MPERRPKPKLVRIRPEGATPEVHAAVRKLTAIIRSKPLEVRALAWVAVHADGSITSQAVTGEHAAQLLGGTVLLQRRVGEVFERPSCYEPRGE